MANYQTIDLPSQMLTQQANASVQFLIQQYQSSTIQSPSDLLQIATTLFQEFYSNLGKPLVSSLVFSGIPIAQDWNTYQRRCYTDLYVLYNQTNQIAASLSQAYAFNLVEDQMLVAAANNLKNQVSSFQATKTIGLGLQSWIAGDDFFDQTKIDTSNTTALVTTGTVQLSRTASTDYSSEISIAVDDEYITSILAQDTIQQIAMQPLGPSGISNGFLGTTHEVVVNENTNTSSASGSIAAVPLNVNPGDTISFAGDSGLHADINAVLDSDPNTWFEYELCNIPDAYKLNPCLNYGFTYTLGRADGTTLEVPWYVFHDDTDVTSSSSSITPTAELYPDLPSTQTISAYSTTSTNQSTLVTATSGSNVDFTESGAPQTGGTLRLALNATLTADRLMALITILPNVINNCTPTIVSVQVRGSNDTDWTNATPVRSAVDASNFIDISGTLPSLTSSPSEDTLFTYVFPSMLVSYIRIIIQQDQAYNTNIGHIVWTEDTAGITSLPTQSSDVYNALFAGQPDSSATGAQVVRIDGPSISLENLVASASGSTSSVGAVEGLIAGIGSFLSGAATSGVSTTGISGPYLEYFPGWRYAIGIRDISFGIYSYATTSTLVSKDFSVPVDIKFVSLQVHEDIPNSTDVPQYVTSTEWITYSVSFDGGSTWNPIAPASHYFSQYPKIIAVNPVSGPSSVPNSQGMATTSGYIQGSNPATKLRIRAVITRPDAVNNLSPMLYRYQLTVQGNPI